MKILNLIKTLKTMKKEVGDLLIVMGDHFSSYFDMTSRHVSIRRLDRTTAQTYKCLSKHNQGDMYLTLNQTAMRATEHCTVGDIS